MDNTIVFPNTYPLDSDLFPVDGWRYLMFEQLGPDLQNFECLLGLSHCCFHCFKEDYAAALAKNDGTAHHAVTILVTLTG